MHVKNVVDVQVINSTIKKIGGNAMKNHIEQEQPNKQFFNYILKLLEWNTFIASYSYFVFCINSHKT